MVELTVDALRNPVVRGREYRRLKHFRKESKAEKYKSELDSRFRSKRYPPIIEKVKIGLGLGYRYYVCVPKNNGG